MRSELKSQRIATTVVRTYSRKNSLTRSWRAYAQENTRFYWRAGFEPFLKFFVGQNPDSSSRGAGILGVEMAVPVVHCREPVENPFLVLLRNSRMLSLGRPIDVQLAGVAGKEDDPPLYILCQVCSPKLKENERDGLQMARSECYNCGPYCFEGLDNWSCLAVRHRPWVLRFGAPWLRIAENIHSLGG